jgi:hypothetical protein
MTYLNEKQVERLLAPINGSRVLDLKGMAYVAQHDVRAHMNRIFGFARWSTDVLETVFLFEQQDEKTKRWRVGYRATVKVTVYSPDGTELAHYTDSHAGSNAPQPNLGDAHGLSLTSVVSTAFKRACTNLGDQFGLSLYEKGMRTAIVKGTLVGSPEPHVPDVPVEHAEEAGSESEPTPEQVEAKAKVDEAGDASHDEMLTMLRELWTMESDADRILGVAGFKTKYADHLDDTTKFQGETITFARLADKIATKALTGDKS